MSADAPEHPAVTAIKQMPVEELRAEIRARRQMTAEERASVRAEDAVQRLRGLEPIGPTQRKEP